MNEKKGELLASAQKHIKKITAGLISFILIAILLISGPANALSLSLGSVSNSSPTKGSIISFLASMNLQNGDVALGVRNFTLAFDGPADKTCIFNFTGGILNGCEGISITRITSPSSINYEYNYGHDSDGNSFNYGYGYTYVAGIQNSFVFNVTLNSSNYTEGAYSVAFSTKIGSITYSASPITFGVLNSTQTYADNETVIVYSNATEVIVPADSPIKNIIIDSSVSSNTIITLDLRALKNDTGGLSLVNNLTLTRETTGYNYSAEISAGTTISGGSAWDGKIILPTVKTASDYSAPSGSADVVIDLGSTIELNFSKAVKIVLDGMAGKKAAWTRGTSLTDITTQCNSATSPTNINSTSPRECYINSESGSDLLIFTYHFTKFAAYTPTVISYGGGGGTRGHYSITTNVASTLPILPAAEIILPVANTIPAVSQEKENKILFDINLKILSDISSKKTMTGFTISSEGILTIQIGLLNIGDPGRVSATVNYRIEDVTGNIVYDKTEIVPVETQNEFIKELDVSNLSDGKYTAVAILTYEGQKEPARAEEVFYVQKSFMQNFGRVILLVLGFVMISLLVIWLIFKKKVYLERLAKKVHIHFPSKSEKR